MFKWSKVVATACCVGLLAFATAANANPVTKVTVRNAGKEGARDVPVTFGQVFKKGDIKQGVLVNVAGTPGQADVKRHYDDGSVRFAVISALLANVPAGGQAVVDLSDGDLTKVRPTHSQSPNVSAAALLKTDFNTVVTLKFPDGTSVSASARKLLQSVGDKPKTWLAGPVATEWLLSGDLVGKDGKADPDLKVQFQVRAYAGCKAVRVSVVVENCLDTWAGNIGYNAAVTLGKDAKPIFEADDVNHRRLSRWRKEFWYPTEPAAVDVTPDNVYLLATGALPNYDRSVKMSEETLARMAADWAKNPDAGIMRSGSLCKCMSSTNYGRDEVGPYPVWTARYLLSLDPRAKTVVLGNADLAGSWPIHVRNSKTGRIMTLDERPKFWFDRSPDTPVWQADRKEAPAKGTPEAEAYTLTPDLANMGSFAYVPYLLTGDFYYLEEAYFWGNYTLLSGRPAERQDGKGLMCGQIHGNAWGLRNIADAGFIAPDGDPEANYFEQRIHNNMEFMTARMYGPPEYNKMGFWFPRDTDIAPLQNAANPNRVVMASWQYDYLIWSLHHLTELRYADAAKPRDFLLRWRVGTFVNRDEFDPQLSAPYLTVVGEIGPDKKVAFYEDWKKLAEENLKMSKPQLSTYFAFPARMAVTCGVDARFPKADEALKWLNTNLPNIPLFPNLIARSEPAQHPDAAKETPKPPAAPSPHPDAPKEIPKPSPAPSPRPDLPKETPTPLPPL